MDINEPQFSFTPFSYRMWLGCIITKRQTENGLENEMENGMENVVENGMQIGTGNEKFVSIRY